MATQIAGLAGLAAHLSSTPCVAQEAQRNTGTAVDRSDPNLPVQKIGPNDLIAVSAYDAPELTRTIRVSDSGVFRLPMLREPIVAAGLMPVELEKSISEALTAGEFLFHPSSRLR